MKRRPEQLSILTLCGMKDQDVRNPAARRLVPQGKQLLMRAVYDDEGRVVELTTEVVCPSEAKDHHSQCPPVELRGPPEASPAKLEASPWDEAEEQ